MASGKRKPKKRKGGGGPTVATDPVSIGKEILAEVEAIDADPAGGGARWGTVHRLLLRAKVDPGESGRIIAGRDVTALRAAADRLVDPDAAAAAEAEAEAPEAETPTEEVSADVRKRAFAAFKKRLKLARLDHESRLGVGPMSGGKDSDIDAIVPPHEYGPEVWAALVADGRLARAGRGFYRLAD